MSTAEPASGRRQAPSAATGSNAVAARSPGGEGIAVHGHWTIDVKNADGSIADHRDFENALTKGQLLVQLLAGTFTVADLGVFMDTSSSNVCMTSSLFNGVCGIVVSRPQIFGLLCNGGVAGSTGNCNINLTIVTDHATGKITLSGLIPVVAAGSFDRVRTVMAYCYNPTFGGPPAGLSIGTPRYCNDGTGGPINVNFLYDNLTGTTINPGPISVTVGQLLQVTVVLTFS